MSQESSTPRTDAAPRFYSRFVDEDFAKQLERELNQAKADIAELLARLHDRTEAVLADGQRYQLKIAALEREMEAARVLAANQGGDH